MHPRIISLARGASLGVVLAACGGGGGDPTTAGTGPMAEPPPTNVTAWRSNPAAHDLRDHWNDPETITERWSLEPVEDPDARKRAVATLLASAAAELGGSGTKLRNISIDHLTILGERDGITYGQWKSGPAGTLNIEFDYRFAQGLDAAARAWMERAGKAWSRRLRDDFGANTVPRGTVIERYPRLANGQRVTVTREIDEDLPVDDVLIAVVYPDTAYYGSSGGAHRYTASEDDLKPWFGSILLAQRHLNRPDVMAHEVGHVIGVRAAKRHFASVSRHIDFENHTFEGPQARRANGGAPVPFQWVNERNEPVAPGTPGATVDWDHFAACNSLMSYCRDRNEVQGPTELDFAYLADIGYELLDAATAAEPEVYGYGAWARYSAWGAGVERELVHDQDRPVDRLRAGADAFGNAPGGPLASSTLEGDVTWTGSLIGVDLGSAALPPVAGDAGLRVDLASLDGRATFERLTVHAGGASRPFRAPSLEYAIAVTDNAFSDQHGRVQGGFFGPAHEGDGGGAPRSVDVGQPPGRIRWDPLAVRGHVRPTARSGAPAKPATVQSPARHFPHRRGTQCQT